MSREALAGETCISVRRIGVYERGGAAISAVDLHRMAGVLKTTIAGFFEACEGHAGRPRLPTVFEGLATTDEGASLAEAFARIHTPRLRRHLVSLAEELAAQDLSG